MTRAALWAVPATLAALLVLLLPEAERPPVVPWVLGVAVLVLLACLVARRRVRVVGVAALGCSLGMLVQLRLGEVPGRLAIVGVAATASFVAATLVGRSRRSARLEAGDTRRTVALAALGLALLMRGLTAVGPAPASGTLPFVPLQVGELTRHLLVAGAALALADPWLRLTGPRGVDRRVGRALAGLAVACLGTLVLVGDLGPAVLAVLAVGAAVVHTRGLGARHAALGALAVVALLPLAWASSSVLRLRTAEVVTPGPQLRGALSAAWSGGLIGPGPGRSPLVDGIPAIGSDYAVAALVADLGAVVAVPVLLALLAVLVALLRLAAGRTGTCATVAVALTTVLAGQAAWNALGAVGVLPLTGLNQPFVGVSGASLTTCAAVLGLVLGLLDTTPRPGTPPGAPVLLAAATHGARAVSLLLVVAAALLVVVPRDVSDAEQLRMPRGTIWTADGTIVAADDGDRRAYPAGGRFADLGFERRHDTHRGVEAVEADVLTCGGALGPVDLLSSLFHPVCRPADLVTTVDSRVQEALAGGLGGADGEAVLVDARSGAVAGLFSTASTAPGVPSRARSAQGPPGSTFKLVTVAAALMGGIDLRGAPPGVFDADDGSVLANDGGAICPATDAATALADSCNSVLGWAAVQVGPRALADVAREYFGADQPFGLDGLDVAGLETGLGASPVGGALARTGIGQESARSSVLGVAVATSVVAAGGGTPAPWPHVVAAVCRGGVPQPRRPAPAVGTPLPDDVAAVIRSGMHRAVTEGTARRLRTGGRDVAAKTGTAQLADGGTDSWITAIIDDRWVLTLVVHHAARDGAAVDAASQVLTGLPPTSGLGRPPSTCPGPAVEVVR